MNALRLDTLTLGDLDTVLPWRAAAREGLRTPYLISPMQQADFYTHVVNRRDARDRYWAVRQAEAYPDFVAMVGLTGIEWENGRSEIALMTDPARRGQGIGRAALALLLEEAFDRLRLMTVVAEVYHSNADAVGFWRKVLHIELQAHVVTLPRRKWWAGQLWPSDYYTVTVDAWNGRQGRGSMP